jgi:L-lactate dehydrogenase complex protein LldE
MIEVFADSETVVTPSGSCCSIVREYFPHLLKGDPAEHRRAQALADRTFEFTEFLQKQLKVDWSAWDLPFPGVATFHYSCHNRGIGMSIDDVLSLVRVFKGLDYRPLVKAEQCCGFGGTFAVKFGEISGAMVRDKVDCIKATGADTLICNDGGCTLNIIGALHREGVNIRVFHVASMLDEAMRTGNNRHLYARPADGPVSVPVHKEACACCTGAAAATGASTALSDRAAAGRKS